MAKKALLIDEENYKQVIKYVKSQGNNLDQLVLEYINILNQLKSTGLISGDVADALNEYISAVTQLNQQFGIISENVVNILNTFMENVKRDDTFSYSF